MPESLLDSQFAALEEPEADEDPIAIGVGAAPESLVEILRERLEASDDPRNGVIASKSIDD